MRKDKGGDICPKIKKNVEKASKRVVAAGHMIQVELRCDAHVVNTHVKTCTCRRWNLSGISCIHACLASVLPRVQPMQLFSSCYLKDKCFSSYEQQSSMLKA